MNTLDEAWEWYRAAAAGAKRLTHLAKYWGELPWGQENEWVSRIERDSVLNQVEADQMENEAQRVTRELDDLAVLVLFSVFEANVRDRVQTQLRPEVDKLVHPALREAGEEVLQQLAEGSFFRVIERVKAQLDASVIEPVNQVRRFRNWVAHGRRPLKEGEHQAKVQPTEAYQRLKKFLECLAPRDVQAQDGPPT